MHFCPTQMAENTHNPCNHTLHVSVMHWCCNPLSPATWEGRTRKKSGDQGPHCGPGTMVIMGYPLVIFNSLLLKMTIYSGFTHWKWWFSIVMLVYQRVILGVAMVVQQNHSNRLETWEPSIQKMPKKGMLRTTKTISNCSEVIWLVQDPPTTCATLSAKFVAEPEYEQH